MNHMTNGWILSDFNTYETAYSQFGGSICSHPDIIRFLSSKGAVCSFYEYRRKGELICATYATDKDISIDGAAYPFLFNNIIIPYNKQSKKISLPFKTKHLSTYHAGDFYNCTYWKGLKRKTCEVKHDFSVATHKKRRQAVKKFYQAGGECLTIDHFSNEELSDIYCTLFKLRWGSSLPCYPREILSEVLSELRHLVFGHVLLIQGKPCAYDLVFQAECKEWYFFDCVNGGYDPAYSDLSVGSILMYLNIQKAKELCQAADVKMIFTLGMDNPKWQYKYQWCNSHILGRSLVF